ncbi:TlpA family protein disulfide reductase [Pseudotamlana agarivorans]|uniref:TlpA family protein disulfide reductase n=1 Tax=Pseudotamlana agarivorans TaxID=481183 RepID=UPI0008362959|nr:TlpA disulfide reductase family protein [Tamlana agarivorans]
MKKTTLSFGLVLTLMACNKKAPLDYAILTGQINNLEAKEINLEKTDQSYIKDITVAPNGSFTDTIKQASGVYQLTVEGNSIPVYLENENVVKVTADAKEFSKSLEASGEGSQTTKYFIFKRKKTQELKGKKSSFYALEEEAFKNKAKNISTTLNTVLDTVKGVDPAFKTLEKRSLNYAYLLELSRYSTGYHSYWAKNRDYEPSRDLLAELEVVDVTNEEDYKFSPAYKHLVTAHYVKMIRALSEKDSIDFALAKVKVHSKISNTFIKNDLIFSGAEYGMVKTENFEDYYKIFMSASTVKEHNDKITLLYNKLLSLKPGQPSPKFMNYENNSGGTLSLDDLKGKFTYIDVWATWCSPCLAQVPHLKKLEKAYHGKQINFLSISIDASKDYEKWKKMIVEKELGGIQVIADKAAESQFTKDYFISSIPRFILIDPNGLIVTKDAPRPSSPELIDLFNSLNI